MMTIIQPERAADWGKVLVQGYFKEGGILPKWPLASSYTEGCHGKGSSGSLCTGRFSD
ncbi:MAG: hypothetical protein ACLR6J_04595 [Parabacteroides merdae]